jgi:hypothetical protein
MSDEAQDHQVTKAAKKPVKKAGARPRQAKPKSDAAAAKPVRAARSPSVVPEIPAPPPGATSRAASAWRLGLLTTTLAVMIGGLAWFSEAPDQSRPESSQLAFGSSGTTSGSADPLAPHVRQAIEQDLRLASMALEIRESQENIMRLWEDARSLASSIGALASGIESIKSDINAVRSDAVAEIARMDNRVQNLEIVANADTSTANELIAHDSEILSRVQRLEAQPRSVIARASPQPAITGALPEVQGSPQATVKVSFNKPKPRARAAKPIDGWLVHNVRDDLALVENNGAHYEVRTGELLPDAGIVRSIKKRGEKWVVLTTKGTITEAR